MREPSHLPQGLAEPSAPPLRRSRQSAERPGRQRSARAQTLWWQKVVVAVMSGVAASMQALPRPAAMLLGRAALGRLAYRVAKRQRRRAQRNLHLAYGDALPARERDILVRRMFEHFGMCVVDFLRGPKMTSKELDALVTPDGWEHVQSARSARRGVILLSAHLGNWELLGRWLAAQGLPLTVVAREAEAPSLAAYLRRMREGAGFAVLNKGESARELLSVLRRGEAILLMPDQNSGDLFVPFFVVPAGTVVGPASLALHTGAALIPCFCG